jgi:hypothetical protein
MFTIGYPIPEEWYVGSKSEKRVHPIPEGWYVGLMKFQQFKCKKDKTIEES